MVLGLSEEDFLRVDGFGRDNGITFPLLLHNNSINPYGVPLDGNFAVEVVVDRQGKVAYAGVGSTAQSLIPIIESVL
ncbi:MAG: hypothetical protein KDK70_26160 [Myxococcales bacterium]|nr:hypothetical protein [Myxococcales bacterium]